MTSFDRFLVHPVELLVPATTTNRYGDTVADWSSPATIAERGWITRETSTEVAGGREAVTSEWSLTLPATSQVAANHRVRYDGVDYEIVGDIERASTPRGAHHLVVRLRSVRG